MSLVSCHESKGERVAKRGEEDDGISLSIRMPTWTGGGGDVISKTHTQPFPRSFLSFQLFSCGGGETSAPRNSFVPTSFQGTKVDALAGGKGSRSKRRLTAPPPFTMKSNQPSLLYRFFSESVGLKHVRGQLHRGGEVPKKSFMVGSSFL